MVCTLDANREVNRSGFPGGSIGWKDGVHVRSVWFLASGAASVSAGDS
jgi:hypothetical protein